MIDPWGLQAQDDDFPSHYGPVVDIVGQRSPRTPFEESANRYRVVYNAGASGYYMNNADNIAPERKAPGMSREEQERQEERNWQKMLEDEGIKRGDQVMEPLDGFWDHFTNFLSSRTYFDGEVSWMVGSDGKIIMPAFMTGSPDLIGGIGKGAFKIGLSIKSQASALSKKIGKNSVTINTPNKKMHYDLKGASHKGVETPHVQQSLKNVNPNGEVYFNKDRTWVRPMNQQDIRVVRNYLNKK